MIIHTSTRYPEILDVKIQNVPRKPEHDLLEKWGWCQLRDVMMCLNAQELGGNFSQREIITNFAALNGHINYCPVVTYLATRSHGRTQPDYGINQPLGEFAFDDCLSYLLPSAWVKKILGLKMKHAAKLAVDGIPLYAIGVDLVIPQHKPILFARAVAGNYWELPIRLCPDRSKVSVESNEE
jgi:hypothetical protein